MVVVAEARAGNSSTTPNLSTKIVDFRGFDSSTILIQRGEIPRPIGDLPEKLSQAMLVGTMWRLGVAVSDKQGCCRSGGFYQPAISLHKDF